MVCESCQQLRQVQKFSQQANDVRDSVALRVVEGAAGLPASAQAGGKLFGIHFHMSTSRLPPFSPTRTVNLKLLAKAAQAAKNATKQTVEGRCLGTAFHRSFWLIMVGLIGP